jgi:hypothetical protein
MTKECKNQSCYRNFDMKCKHKGFLNQGICLSEKDVRKISDPVSREDIIKYKKILNM